MMFRSLTLVSLVAASVSLAQAQAPAYRVIDFCELHPGQGGNAAAAYREYAEQLKKAGWDRDRLVLRSQSGPQTMAVVRYYRSHADMSLGTGYPAKLQNNAATMNLILARLNATCARMHREIDLVIPELFSGSVGDPPRYYQRAKVTVKPEKIDEFRTALLSDIGPAIKKSGAKRYVAAQAEFGVARSVFSIAYSIESLASLDKESAIATAMGKDGYQRYLAKVRPLITEAVYDLWEYMPDLSYIAPK